MKILTRHEILARMCTVLNVSVEDILGTSRNRKLVAQRRMIIWYLHTELEMGCSDQGKLLNRNHATILHSIKRMKDELFLYKDTQEEYAEFARDTKFYIYKCEQEKIAKLTEEAKPHTLTDDAIEALTLH